MAVLVEATSVVVRREAIELWLEGGMEHFQALVPNETLCSDDDIVRVGFMTPADTEAFVRRLQAAGLTYLENKKAIDLVVVDQDRGAIARVDWLEVVRFTFDDGETVVTAAYLLDDSLPSPRRTDWLSAPDWWSYEGSISQKRTVHRVDDHPEVELLDHHDGLDVYRDLATGERVYVGRTQPVTVDAEASRGWPESLDCPWTPCTNCTHMQGEADSCEPHPDGIPERIRGANLAARPSDPRRLCPMFAPRGGLPPVA